MNGIRSLWLAVAVVLGAGPVSFAQNGEVTGRVTDSQDAAVHAAIVRVVNQATGVERKTTTNSEGLYFVPFIPPGDYQIFVQAPGFATAASPTLSLNVGQALVYTVKLKIGTMSETVEVSGAPPLTQTEDASVGQVMTTSTINATPLNGRNWVYIAQLAAGVDPPDGSRGNGKGDFNANGQRAEQNNFILDGVDNNTNVVDFLNGSSFVVRPPPDALAEFNIQTSNYGAEYGHSAGAVVNATLKSGTNQIHGNIWEYLRNTALDARDWENASVPNYHENQFGGTLGFPVIHNKLFFFGDLEANRIIFQETDLLTVPTALMRQGNFTELLNPTFAGGAGIALTEPGSGQPMGSACGNPTNVMCPSEIDAVAQRLLQLYPMPNVNTAVFSGNFLSQRNSRDNTLQFDTRVDWNARNADQYSARFSFVDEPSFRSPPLGPVLDGGNFLTFGDDGNIVNVGQNFGFGETHVFSNSLTNELRFGYNWGHFAFRQQNATNPQLAAAIGFGGIPGGPNNGGLPAVNIGGISGFGSPEFYASNEAQGVVQILDNVSKTFGKHSLKFGVNVQRIRFSTEQPPMARGEYDYYAPLTATCADSVTYTGYGVSDFLANSMGCAEFSNIASTDEVRWERALYAQDDWKLTPRLTLNLGLRYEYPQTYREVDGRQAEWHTTGALVAGNTSSVYVVPAMLPKAALGSTFPALLANDHVTLQYSGNPYLVSQDKVNFAPRVGSAFRLTDRVTARAGFGVFFGGLESVGYTPNLGENFPFVYQSTYLASAGHANGTDGITLENGFGSALSTGLLNAIVSPSLRGVDPSVKTPYTEDYNFSVEYSVKQNMAATVSYAGAQSRHLIVLTNPNAPLALQNSNAADSTLYQPLRDFGAATFSAYAGISNYHSLQAKLERRFANGLNFLATYTWAHSLDDAPTPLGSNGDNGYPNTNLQTIRDQYSNSPFDTRQRFTFNGSYELPFGHGERFANRGGIVEHFARGWSASLTFIAQTGNPFSVVPYVSSTYSAPNGATGVYAVLAADPFKPEGTGNTCATAVRNRNNWYNPCAFANPPSGGNIIGAVSGVSAQPYLGGRRDDIYGPGYERINMSWSKKFRIHESKDLQFRADIFNLFNTPSYANPNNNASGGGLQSGVNNTSSAGGQITLPRFFQNFTPDARFIQFALKFSF